ncbi:hypothetical protein LCGC14_2290770 [marine sediment metagenome]|uniref:Uncharacterized protein n=1 Tax=marine sediment metagenome TaxID=412755 RepID=A0A0F9F3U6_9ZZZZ
MATRILNAIDVYAMIADEGDSVTVADLDLETEVVDEAITLHRDAVRLRKAAAAVEAATAVQLAEVLGDGGAVRDGDTVYRYGRGWSEKVNDSGAFWAMLDKFDVRMADLFNPNTVRKAQLPEAVRDTAFTKTRDEDPSLTAVTGDYIPVSLEDLEDGDYVIGRRV